MALQDLTPQLRTRLSRMERAVGWFVILAMALLGFGFVYYVYTTAERKGWFVTKALYFTFVHSAAGIKPGDPVKLMGFDVGQITQITGMAPFSGYDVYIEFEVKEPYFDYLWTQGSVAKVAAAGLLANRELEVAKGTNGYPTFTQRPLKDVEVAEVQLLEDWTNWGLAQEIRAPHGTNLLGKPWQALTNVDLRAIAAAGHTNIRIMSRVEKRKALTGIWQEKELRYAYYDRLDDKARKYWLPEAESPAVSEQAQQLVAQIQAALPGILALTNQVSAVLSNSTVLTSNLSAVALDARPAVSNLANATAQLNHPGALGEWLLPTNINHQLETTLSNAGATLTNANTNLAALAENIGRSLDNLAGITSNLNKQVEANTNLLSAISKAIVDADNFVQGLKRHWLFRSAFKTRHTNAPPVLQRRPLLSPKEQGEQ